MCSLCFENNLLTDGRVRFASKIIFVLSNVFASFRKYFAYYRRCSLRFDIEENTIIEVFVRFRFARVAITTGLLDPTSLCPDATGEACSPNPTPHPEFIRNQHQTVRCIKERSGA